MTAPAGAIVRIYVDLRETVWPGDLIETPTKRSYLVVDNRIQRRGKHAGRQHLSCSVLGDDPDPCDTVGRRVHRIRWYKRAKAGARRGGCR